MEQKKFLDLNGLKHYNDKLKSGTVVVGRANVANQIQSSGIQWGSETVPLANIPKAAMERCVVVVNQAAMFALTKDQIQNGDTVKVTDGGRMFFVKDDNNLNSMAGYEAYVAGTAATAEIADSVEWSGVKNKPETYKPAEHATDVVTALTGFQGSYPINNKLEDISTIDTLNQALGKIYANETRLTQVIDIKNLNDPIDNISERKKNLSGRRTVTRYDLITTKNGELNPVHVGYLEEFTDVFMTNITQIATTSLDLGRVDGGYVMRECPYRWVRRYKIKNYQADQLNKWSPWEICLDEKTKILTKRNIMIPFGGIVNGVSIESSSTNDTNGTIVYDSSSKILLYKIVDDFGQTKYYQTFGAGHLYGEESAGAVKPYQDILYYNEKDGSIFLFDGTDMHGVGNNTEALSNSEIDSIF
jgi:hypothetical protein